MEFTEALSANPLAAIAVIGLVVAALVAPWWFLGGGKVPSARNSTLRGIAWALVVAAAVNWIYLISVGV
jgi:hypothetical protein